MNKYPLITGATGFIGTNLCQYLAKYYIQAKVLSRKELWSDLNIHDETLAVIHLAGKAHDLKNQCAVSEYYDVNYGLTKKLYDAFLLSKATKFIFISSVKAAADSVEGVLMEDIVPSPTTHYGKSKLDAENYIQSQELPEGKSYYILRPCMTHGPGNKGNLNLLHKFVQKGIPYPLASFENRRSFLSVENLCFIIKELLHREGIPSGIYNVADDKSLPTNEVVAVLADSMNRQPKLWHISKSLLKTMAKVGDYLRLPLSTERLNKLTENYVVSNEKIKNALDIKMPVQTKEGLRITANSFNAR